MPYLPEYDSPELLEGVKNKTMKTETSFTPGPWFHEHRRGNDGMYRTQIFTADGLAIATFEWYPMPPQKERLNGKPVTVTGTYREGNATLCAAAPDLYEALANILSLAEGDNTPDPAEMKQIATWASAALSKANA